MLLNVTSNDFNVIFYQKHIFICLRLRVVSDFFFVPFWEAGEVMTFKHRNIGQAMEVCHHHNVLLEIYNSLLIRIPSLSQRSAIERRSCVTRTGTHASILSNIGKYLFLRFFASRSSSVLDSVFIWFYLLYFDMMDTATPTVVGKSSGFNSNYVVSSLIIT